MTGTTTDAKYATTGEVARHLRVSPDTIRRLARSGHLPPPVRLGARTLRWRWSDVRQLAGEILDANAKLVAP